MPDPVTAPPAYPQLERRSYVEQRLTTVEASLDELLRQREVQQKSLDELRDTLNDLRDLLAAWETTRGAFHMLRALGNVARWLFTVGAALLAIWLWFKSSVK